MKKLAFGLSLVCFFTPALACAQNAYITNAFSNTVSVIDTATNTVVGSPITVGNLPEGVALTPDGSKVYVANANSGTVTVIATATNTVVGSPISVGSGPTAFGLFIQPRHQRVQRLHRQADGFVVPAEVHAAVQFHLGKQQ
jgi:YVTN family beta-propeller protein